MRLHASQHELLLRQDTVNDLDLDDPAYVGAPLVTALAGPALHFFPFICVTCSCRQTRDLSMAHSRV